MPCILPAVMAYLLGLEEGGGGESQAERKESKILRVI
jgi:hypothetical protein